MNKTMQALKSRCLDAWRWSGPGGGGGGNMVYTTACHAGASSSSKIFIRYPLLKHHYYVNPVLLRVQ